MNKEKFTEVRPNIWIANSDPLFDKKFAEYSGSVKTVGSLVTEETEESIRKFIPGFDESVNKITSVTEAPIAELKESINNVPTSNNNKTELKYTSRKERKMMENNSFSFGRFLKTCIAVAIFLSLFACTMFVLFYLLVNNL